MNELETNLNYVNDIDIWNGFYFIVDKVQALRSEEKIDQFIYNQLKKLN